jgi:hypothetical protein
MPSHNNQENRLILYKEFENWAANLEVTDIKIIAYGHEKTEIAEFYTGIGFNEHYKILDKAK